MENKSKNIIYFDNAATTKVSNAAAQKAMQIMTELYANPSSVHSFGISAANELEAARKSIISALGFSKNDGILYFTGSGTEAANLAILGYARANKRKGNKILASDSEHPCVFNTLKKLSDEGFDVKFIPTNGGEIDTEFARSQLSDGVLLISCMTINNETGAFYDISSLIKLRNELCPDAVIHTDAVQAFLKTKESVGTMFPGVDMVSVSSHKIHAPKGCGALWVRKSIKLSQLLYGGEQEGALRPGTEALPNICAFGAAAEIGAQKAAENFEKVSVLMEYTKRKITELCPDVYFNQPKISSPYILSVVIPGIRSEIMLRKLSEKGICVSSGSACSSKHRENRILKAFGLSDSDADFTLRISFSEFNTTGEVDILADTLAEGKSSLITVRNFRRR